MLGSKNRWDKLYQKKGRSRIEVILGIQIVAKCWT